MPSPKDSAKRSVQFSKRRSISNSFFRNPAYFLSGVAESIAQSVETRIQDRRKKSRLLGFAGVESLGGESAACSRPRLPSLAAQTDQLARTDVVEDTRIVINDTAGNATAIALGSGHPSVVELFIGGGLCTGTVIDPTHILTAQHCTFGAAAGAVDCQFSQRQ